MVEILNLVKTVHIQATAALHFLKRYLFITPNVREDSVRGGLVVEEPPQLESAGVEKAQDEFHPVSEELLKSASKA